MENLAHQTMEFSDKIISWYEQNKRDLPWRQTKDPYRVWLSEIILQQTRVDQGWKYYEHFISEYPTVEDLARAPEAKVMKSWEGLGYYSRARNLHASAKFIHEQLDGEFPSTYQEILKLKGVGDYTASAISSFCFGETEAVVDGNVYRLLSRYFGVTTPIDSTKGKKEFKALANEIIDRSRPDLFNQGTMEFGSLQCTPTQPNCDVCPLAQSCFALKNDAVSKLPVKEKKLKQRSRYLDYLVLCKDDQVIINLREKKGIWQKLNEFRLVESEAHLTEQSFVARVSEEVPVKAFLGTSEVVKHQLSHQKLFIRFWEIEVETWPNLENSERIVDVNQLGELAFPRVIDSYLQKRAIR